MCIRDRAFLALYLLVFNDLRYNRQAWRHGVLGMLAARELELPVQKRLSRSAGLVSLSCLLLNCVTAGLLIWCSSWSWGSVRLETAWLLCLPPLLLAAVTAAFQMCIRDRWRPVVSPGMDSPPGGGACCGGRGLTARSHVNCQSEEHLQDL